MKLLFTALPFDPLIIAVKLRLSLFFHYEEMKMNGLMEISEFREEWDGTPNFQVMPVGNLFFCADITYLSEQRGEEHGQCSVHIIRNGMQDGNIEIVEGDGFTAEKHHLGLVERLQTYTFDTDDKSLFITGKSPKMGKYSIRMVPNGLPASWT